jgi:hypothetical protein
MSNTYQQTLQSLKRTLDQNKALLNLSDNDDYAKFKNLDLYNWDKPKEEQEGTFVGLVGLPVKNGKELEMFDYEHDIFRYLERNEPTNPKNKHLAIIKSAGLGITTFLLYYIGYKATVNNAWRNKRVSVITAPRIELTTDIILRLKRLFTNNNLLEFNDDKSTTCTINGCVVEALPASNAAIKSIRGYDNIVMLLVDEASWFNLNQNQNVTDSIERYAAKSNPIIVACSTPQTVGDWLYNIKQQPESERFYHLMELSYKVGLGKIYTKQEIELQKKSLSFNREYNLSFEAGIDALFNAQDIDSCIADSYDSTFHNGLTCWAGVDPGYSSSKFAIVVIAWANNKLQVMKELEVDHADPDLMRSTLHSIVQEYSLCRLFIDSSSIYLIRQLCKDYGIPDVTMYDDKTKDGLLLTTGCGGASLIQSVNFRTKHKLMLEQLHRVVSTNQIRVDPRFKGVISALRTATTKQFGDVYDLDKKQSGSNDLLDSLRLSLLCLSSSN